MQVLTGLKGRPWKQPSYYNNIFSSNKTKYDPKKSTFKSKSTSEFETKIQLHKFLFNQKQVKEIKDTHRKCQSRPHSGQIFWSVLFARMDLSLKPVYQSVWVVVTRCAKPVLQIYSEMSVRSIRYWHKLLVKIYSGDLKSKIVRYSDRGDLYYRWMVHYSDAWYHCSSVFRLPFG